MITAIALLGTLCIGIIIGAGFMACYLPVQYAEKFKKGELIERDGKRYILQLKEVRRPDEMRGP